VTQFEFITVFISIVLAFGVSDILSSWGEQIRLRKQIRIYWLHVAWSALLLTLMIQVWWSLWVLRDSTDWTFFKYLLLILPFLTLALIAYLMTPSLQTDESDIKKHYWDNARWMFSLAAFYMCTAMTFSFAIVGDHLLELRNTIRFGAFALMVSLALWQNEKFHAVAAIVGGVLLVCWVGVSMFAL
jgi:hypothetical protein